MSFADVLIKSLQGNAAAEAELQGLLLDLNAGLDYINIEFKAKKNDQIVSGCCLLLKNICEKRSTEILGTNVEIRNSIHENLLELLESSMAPIAISSMAAVEIESWLVVPRLMQIIQSPNSDSKKANALSSIGYICEKVDSEYLKAYANPILTAVIYGANHDSIKVKKASIAALNNSLAFVKDNFQVEGERNYIMETVCTCCIYKDSEVRTVAFECLVKIMTIYYEFMEPYMKNALSGLTTAAMQYGVTHKDEQVALQAIEFWSTICDEEINITQYQDKQMMNFAKTHLKDVVPILTWLLTNCEDVDKDEWCIYTSAVNCLTLFAQLLKNDLANEVIPFIESNIVQNDWILKEGAVTAFGCILDGPDPEYIGHLVNSALPILIGLVGCESAGVRESCVWVLGSICDKLLNYVHPDHFASIVSAFEQGLELEEPVKLLSCIGLGNFIANKPPTSSLVISKLSGRLLIMAGVPTPQEPSRVRRAATETLESFILNSPDCERGVIENIGSQALSSFTNTSNIAIQSNAIIEHLENMGCIVERVVARIDNLEISLVDNIMQTLMGAFTKIPEDCLRIMGTIVLVMGDKFMRYLNTLKSHISSSLNQQTSPSLLRNAIFLLSDIAKMNGSSVFFSEFIEPLFQLLTSQSVEKSVKPVILTCLGDFAAAMGSSFEPYLQNIASILTTASTVIDASDSDFTLELRQATADCLIELLWAMKAKRIVD
eukprot:NODE_23_length_42016_cov_0.755803.p4 type:complete len:719 gc:universal NODE_23_length_42016_cov_0.755803:7958-5802(-)